jgi:hypothetical protein
VLPEFRYYKYVIMPINFAQRPIVSGLWLFNKPEINPSTSAGFEPANFGSQGEHGTPRPPRPTN